MHQSRLMSLVEAVTNVVVGYGVAVLVQLVLFPVSGIHVGISDNLAIGLVFTAVSLARSYLLRRPFSGASPPAADGDGRCRGRQAVLLRGAWQRRGQRIPSGPTQARTPSPQAGDAPSGSAAAGGWIICLRRLPHLSSSAAAGQGRHA